MALRLMMALFFFTHMSVVKADGGAVNNTLSGREIAQMMERYSKIKVSRSEVISDLGISNSDSKYSFIKIKPKFRNIASIEASLDQKRMTIHFFKVSDVSVEDLRKNLGALIIMPIVEPEVRGILFRKQSGKNVCSLIAKVPQDAEPEKAGILSFMIRCEYDVL